MPSFKGDELPLREACWLLSDPSATSGLCASFGKRRRTSRQSFCVDPCLPVESSDEVVARWGFIRSRRRTLLYARARVSAGGRRLCWQSICIKLPLLVYFTQGRHHSVSHRRTAEGGSRPGRRGDWPKGAPVVRGDRFGQVESWAFLGKLAAPLCFGRMRAARPRLGRRRSRRSPGGGSGARGGGCRWRRSRMSSRRRRPPQEREGQLLGRWNRRSPPRSRRARCGGCASSPSFLPRTGDAPKAHQQHPLTGRGGDSTSERLPLTSPAPSVKRIKERGHRAPDSLSALVRPRVIPLRSFLPLRQIPLPVILYLPPRESDGCDGCRPTAAVSQTSSGPEPPVVRCRVAYFQHS